jgi:hypothetical protein
MEHHDNTIILGRSNKSGLGFDLELNEATKWFQERIYTDIDEYMKYHFNLYGFFVPDGCNLSSDELWDKTTSMVKYLIAKNERKAEILRQKGYPIPSSTPQDNVDFKDFLTVMEQVIAIFGKPKSKTAAKQQSAIVDKIMDDAAAKGYHFAVDAQSNLVTTDGTNENGLIPIDDDTAREMIHYTFLHTLHDLIQQSLMIQERIATREELELWVALNQWNDAILAEALYNDPFVRRLIRTRVPAYFDGNEQRKAELVDAVVDDIDSENNRLRFPWLDFDSSSHRKKIKMEIKRIFQLECEKLKHQLIDTIDQLKLEEQQMISAAS